MRFEIDVTETRAVHMRYVVEAPTAREAERMAAIGSTVEERHLGDGGVLDRNLVSTPSPLPEQGPGRAYLVAMDISARVDAEVLRAYLLGAKGAEAGAKLLEEDAPLALLAGLALTHDAPKLEDVGLADLKLIPHPPEDTAYPTFRLEVTVTDLQRLEREAAAMYERAYGGEPEWSTTADLPELAYEALIGSNGGPEHLDFGVEFMDRRTRECLELSCSNCGSALSIEGRWPEGGPTYIDNTGGDVCAANGSNDRHQVGMRLLGLAATPGLER